MEITAVIPLTLGCVCRHKGLSCLCWTPSPWTSYVHRNRLQHLKSFFIFAGQERPLLAIKPQGNLLRKSTQTPAESLHMYRIKSRSLQTWVGSLEKIPIHVWFQMQSEQILSGVWKVNIIQCITWSLFFKQAAVASIFKFDSVSAAAPSKSDYLVRPVAWMCKGFSRMWREWLLLYPVSFLDHNYTNTWT